MFNFKAIAGVVETFSPSKLGCYGKCRLNFKLRYVDKIKINDVAQTVETLAGKALHDLASLYNGGDIFSLAQESFKKNGLLWLPDNKDMNKCVLNIKAFWDGLPTMPKSPIFREATVNAKLNDSVNLTGIMDLVFTDKDGVLNVVDYKTSKSRDDSRHIDQLQAYIFIAAQFFKTPVERIKAYINYLKLGVMGEPQVGQSNAMATYAYDMKNRIAKIQATVDFPPSPGFLCKYCDYKNSRWCSATNGK